MKQTRFLLPFTHGVQGNALDQAIQLAKSRNATLIPVSLIHVPHGKSSRGPRLEFVQQSQDFLEAVQHRAAKCHVPIEKVEILSSNIGQSIEELAEKMDCEAVLLFMRGKECMMLNANDVKHIVEHTPRKLYIFRLEAKDNVRLHVC